ncbi:MAG: hypothetical protein PHQ40_15315 [Anaerolineaceae bacterium]|nr:hypothetical protein [Anaerolineaceae bacterium]
MSPKVDVPAREHAILQFLRKQETGSASVKDIYDNVTSILEDNVTLTAYYKILDRMEASGKVETSNDDPERGRLYTISPTLHVGNPLTLDDIYELLPFFRTTEALARIVDAQNYYEENSNSVIRKAAEALLDEDPVDIFLRMILDLANLVQKDIEILRHKNEDGVSEIADSPSERRLEADYRRLEGIAYRGLSLPHEALFLPSWVQIINGIGDVKFTPKLLKEALKLRVFGNTFIRKISPSDDPDIKLKRNMTISGSDGSMHAGTLAIRTARGFYEDVSDVITFNNSMVYIRLSGIQEQQEGREEMVHSAPFTRQTIDDPSYKGMVLAQSLFPGLSESEYEHMSKAATDVVQFRVDESVFTGTAKDLRPPHSLIPKPHVHLRDGTIVPQEREFHHYNRQDPYGEIVREGIRLERKILERIMIGKDRATVFGGAVKSTELRIFSQVINWYIVQGSRERFGHPIAADWDYSRAANITDNMAITTLLSSLPAVENQFYVTCAILRQFPAVTEYYAHQLAGETWSEFFNKKKEHALLENERYGGDLPFIATVDAADDDFVFMCENADFVSFYIGHTAGEPPPLLPRYEFLTSLRDFSMDENGRLGAGERVDRVIQKIVDALSVVKFSIDREHNFLSDKILSKIIPSVIYRAHEFAKSLGKKLEAELKSIVVSRLIEINKLRPTTTGNDVEVRPVSIRSYMERFNQMKKSEQLPGEIEER